MRLLFALLAIFAATAASAHDLAAMTDPDRGKWFESLIQPGTKDSSCCSKRDCHAVKAMFREKQWWAEFQAYDGMRWIAVPNSKIVKNPKSIDGDAYLCASMGDRARWSGGMEGGKQYWQSATQPTIYCFVPPNMGF